jgi:hypothetical protein
MKPTQTTVHFVCAVRTHDALRETAEADARSVSSLIRKIIQDWYDQQHGRLPFPRRGSRQEAATT